MEIKNKITGSNVDSTKKRMRELTKKKNEWLMTNNLEDLFKLMCEENYRTVNLDLNNGYVLVCTILEKGETINEGEKKEGQKAQRRTAKTY